MEAMTAATLLIFPAFMAYAAASDLVSMRISNRVSLGLIATFLAFAIICRMPLPTLGWHVAAGFGMLVVGFGMFAMGWIGGGDAKLAAATALWLGPDLLLNYVVMAGFAGGLLTLAILNLRDMDLPLFAARWTWLQRLHHKENGVPYGIALAFAGLMAFPESPIWKLALIG